MHALRACHARSIVVGGSAEVLHGPRPLNTPAVRIRRRLRTCATDAPHPGAVRPPGCSPSPKRNPSQMHAQDSV